MKDREDAYGRLVLDYLETGDGIEIVERDGGFIGASRLGPAAYFAPFRRWPKAERAAMRLVRGRVLDVGCGAGRVALHLQERGHEVVGIDVSPLAVEVAKRRGANDVRLLPVTKVGPSLGRFDTFVMYGSNFGLVGGARRAPWLLRRFGAIASDGARILAGSTNPYTTDNPEHLAYHRRNRSRGRMGGQLRIRIRHGTYKTPWFDYLLASPEEMADLAQGTGWELTRVIGEGEPFYVGVLERAR
ncbi:MAG: class I SAM-dependent methyltransferase [Gaiellaceae bacterium]